MNLERQASCAIRGERPAIEDRHRYLIALAAKRSRPQSKHTAPVLPDKEGALKKVRYAVVGAGWISQEAFMPSVDQTGNSVISAIVTGNRANALKLANFYGIEHVFGYEQYEQMLSTGLADAVYIALPNSMHADFTIKAANAGVHALVEKPLATSVAECEAMIAAAERSGAKLMTAYRLHYEPGTVEALE